MSDYICILAESTKVTRVPSDDAQSSRMWKNCKVVLNASLQIEIWSNIDGHCCAVSSALAKMDLQPAKGSKRVITKSGARYYFS